MHLLMIVDANRIMGDFSVNFQCVMASFPMNRMFVLGMEPALLRMYVNATEAMVALFVLLFVMEYLVRHSLHAQEMDHVYLLMSVIVRLALEGINVNLPIVMVFFRMIVMSVQAEASACIPIHVNATLDMAMNRAPLQFVMEFLPLHLLHAQEMVHVYLLITVNAIRITEDFDVNFHHVMAFSPMKRVFAQGMVFVMELIVVLVLQSMMEPGVSIPFAIAFLRTILMSALMEMELALPQMSVLAS